MTVQRDPAVKREPAKGSPGGAKEPQWGRVVGELRTVVRHKSNSGTSAGDGVVTGGGGGGGGGGGAKGQTGPLGPAGQTEPAAAIAALDGHASGEFDISPGFEPYTSDVMSGAEALTQFSVAKYSSTSTSSAGGSKGPAASGPSGPSTSSRTRTVGTPTQPLRYFTAAQYEDGGATALAGLIQ